MIGDWVRINRDGLCIKKGTIVEVRGIDGDNKFLEKDLHGVADCRPLDKFQFQGGIWCEYLAPIPLTPEILEKNGMILSLCGDFFPEDEHYELEISVVGGRIFWTINGHEYDIMCLRFVHELQHALRLCGITKEIHI